MHGFAGGILGLQTIPRIAGDSCPPPVGVTPKCFENYLGEGGEAENCRQNMRVDWAECIRNCHGKRSEVDFSRLLFCHLFPFVCVFFCFFRGVGGGEIRKCGTSRDNSHRLQDRTSPIRIVLKIIVFEVQLVR